MTFGRNITEKVRNQNVLYLPTSSTLCFCNTWQNTEIVSFRLNAVGLYCFVSSKTFYHLLDR